jgi:hypothetical protein
MTLKVPERIKKREQSWQEIEKERLWLERRDLRVFIHCLAQNGNNAKRRQKREQQKL